MLVVNKVLGGRDLSDIVAVFLQNVISMGGGAELQSEYKSVIYKHQDAPGWYETFKIAVPIEEFYNCHLKFTFKHISGNEGIVMHTISLIHTCPMFLA